MDHPLLGGRLLEICQVLIDSGQSEVREIFPTPDDLKLRSSMTLFSRVPQSNPVFQQVLDKFFHGLPDPRTLTILAQPM